MCEAVRSPSHRRLSFHPVFLHRALVRSRSAHRASTFSSGWMKYLINSLRGLSSSSAAVATDSNLAADVINRQRSFTLYLLFALRPLSLLLRVPFAHLPLLAVIFLARASSKYSTITPAPFREAVKVRRQSSARSSRISPPPNARDSVFFFN